MPARLIFTVAWPDPPGGINPGSETLSSDFGALTSLGVRRWRETFVIVNRNWTGVVSLEPVKSNLNGLSTTGKVESGFKTTYAFMRTLSSD